MIDTMTQKPIAKTQSFVAAPLDRYAERITILIALIGGILMLPTLFWYLSGLLRYTLPMPGLLISVAFALALAVWLVLNYIVQPTRYEIDIENVYIHRRWTGPMSIPFKDILAVSPAGSLGRVPNQGLRRSFNAGVFGYQGPFDLDPYGRVFFVATHRERLVAIARQDKMPLIISPERPRDFIDALREALIKSSPDEAADTNE